MDKPAEQKNNAVPSKLSEMDEKLCMYEQKSNFFDVLMENPTYCIYFKDIELRFIKANNAWAALRNLSNRDEFIGKTDYDFYSQELANVLYKEDHEIIKTRTMIDKIEKIEFGDALSRWISISKFPVIDHSSNEVIGICGIGHDISAATQTKKELENERDMLHMLLDYSHDSIYFKDLESRFLRISRAHSAMQMHFIDSPELAIGKTDFDYFPIEHAQKAFENEMSIIATGEPILGLIERETASGMPEKWVFTSKLPMYDQNGVISGTFGISRDITQIKKYEDELQQSNSELEEHVRLRTKDLVTANTDLERRIAQLNFLSAASHEMAGCIEINDLAAVILNAFSSRLKPTVACLCTSKDDRFTCICIEGILSNSQNKTIIESSIASLKTGTLTCPNVISNWAELLPVISPWNDMYDLTCCVAIPLIADNRHVGILLLFAGEGTLQRFKEEEKVMLTLAVHAATSLSNAIFYKELNEKARLQGELGAARSIQQRLTPRHKPLIPHVNLKGLYSPACEVGGDYLDYFKNDLGYWIVVIADVCGKGIPAALLMTILRSAFHFEARNRTSAMSLLDAVNDSMRMNLDDRSFVTAICLVINPDGTSMSYARAGHPMLIRIHAESNRVETMESNGIALGVLTDTTSFTQMMDELTIPLLHGDRYFIYTDGLTEAFNLDRSPYGMNRLLNLLQNDTSTTPESLVHTIIQDVKAFTQGAPYHDDLTMIALKIDNPELRN